MVKAIQSERYNIPLSTLREAGVVPVVSDRLLDTLELEPWSDRGSAQGESRSRYDRAYLNSLCRLTQIFTLPCGVSQEVLEAAAAETEGASQGQAGGPS